MNATRQLDIVIMGREFRVACPADEEETLKQAVALLEAKMLEIRGGGKVVGIEKIAIMAALNLAHEYLHVQAGGFDIGAYQRKITAMNSAIDAVLQDQTALF
ncbi:cell division protein ZapA [Jeongeupia naejangsanensis]|uniref:Cell division protein ZapA n=1 Tax=Jeongeupia naejangsanensis TaxID=613195 RepID=A0ABS2BLK2_9NEIS|nr:cell division protein ZapA [Jeongeupia naejangsanensis]MBM3116458.1 cell division protein ZapA [Jeongeupia naejangsanensis]